MRTLFAEAANQLGKQRPEVAIAYFRLELDDDLVSQDWIISLGYFEFLPMGAGSLLWLECGNVVVVLATPCGSSVQDLVERTLEIW